MMNNYRAIQNTQQKSNFANGESMYSLLPDAKAFLYFAFLYSACSADNQIYKNNNVMSPLGYTGDGGFFWSSQTAS